MRATSVFDTQLAAGFVGYGISMAYARLVERALSVSLQHNETFSDWSRRPLTEAQIAYASDDVRYLFALADSLVGRLEEMGRRSWAEDEIARYTGLGYDRMPVCIAKTQFSLSHDASLKGRPTGWRLPIRSGKWPVLTK